MSNVTVHPVLGIPLERFEELLRDEIRTLLREYDPSVRAQLARACQLVTEERGIAILAIQGKDPRRTFRRLMHKWRVEKVPRLGYRLDSLERAIDAHTINRKKEAVRLVA